MPDRLEHLHAAGAVGLREGEGDVGLRGLGGRHVLHDHVDVDARLRDGAEDLGGHPDAVRHADDGDLGLAAVVGDAGDDRSFHSAFSFVGVVLDPRAGPLRPRRAHVDGDAVAACVLDAAQVQDLAAVGREVEHLLHREDVELARARQHAGVGGEDAVDVGVDLADVGAEGGRERDRGRVRATAAEGGDVLRRLADALEAGDDGDVPGVERALDAPGGDVDDPCRAVGVVGDDAGLAAGERPGLGPELGDRHGHEGHRDALARGEEHVELARGRRGRHLLGEVHQLVRGVAHGRDDDADGVTRTSGSRRSGGPRA